MASSWGRSWGASWGNSWGVSVTRRGDDAGPRRYPIVFQEQPAPEPGRTKPKRRRIPQPERELVPFAPEQWAPIPAYQPAGTDMRVQQFIAAQKAAADQAAMMQAAHQLRMQADEEEVIELLLLSA